MTPRTPCYALFVAIGACLALAATAQGQPVLHVDDTATGANDGSSWCDAYLYLQDALAAAAASGGVVTEIRVAQGIYTADRSTGNPDGTGDRETTFQLLNGIALRGGYAGCGAPDPDERDIALYETILSGDLADDDVEVSNLEDLLDEPTRAENTYHVVSGSGTDETAILDGFTITAGNAAPYSIQSNLAGEGSRQGMGSVLARLDSRGKDGETCGGFVGIRCAGGKFCKLPVGGCCCDWTGVCTDYPSSCPPDWSPVCGCDGITYINECWADAAGMSLNNRGTCPQGGGILNDRGSPTVSNCTFTGNSAAWSGGGMYTYRGSPTLTSCVFERNYARSGGALYNDESDPLIDTCILCGNSAGSGGAMFNRYSRPMLQDCEFIRNSLTGHGFGAGIYNSYSDLTLINCTLEGNIARAGSGGGMYSRYGSLSMINSIFVGNSASGSPGEGGGLLNWGGNADLSNCTFVGNSAARFGGGMYNLLGSLTVRGSIAWGNNDDNGVDESAQIHTNAGSTLVTYSCIQGLDTLASTGNIGDDPLFVPGPGGCYYLSQTAAGQAEQSPCVDGGSDTAAIIELDSVTTRSDEVGDTGIGDMGYHYPITGKTLIMGDFDRDQRVDLRDFSEFQQCFTGGGATDVTPCCRIFDFEADADVDLRDLPAFESAVTGP